MSLSVCQY